MIKYSDISYDDITAEDMPVLQKALDQDYTGKTLADLYTLWTTGEVGMLRVSGEAHGIIITQIILQTGGKELFIWAMAGENFLQHAEDLKSGLETVAKNKGCKWITGAVTRKGLARLYETWDFKSEYTFYKKDVL